MNSISDYQQSINSWYYNRSYATGLSNNEDTEKVSGEVSSTDGMTAAQPLDGLVAAGTITEDQEEAIKNAIESAMQSSAYSRYMIQSDSTYTQAADPLDSLVESGVITAEQQAAVKDALEVSRPQGMPPPPPMAAESEDEEDNSIESILDGLISSGEITEEQKSSIIEALQSVYESYQEDEEMIWNSLDGNSGGDFFRSRTMPFNSELQSMSMAYETQFEAAQYNEIQDSMQISL